MTKATIRSYREASRLNSAHAALIADCLETIERLQAMTRRGEEPEELPEKAKGKAPADPKIKEFIDLWDYYFTLCFSDKYKVQGVKDAMAVKRLLATGSTVEQLLDLAWEAWQHPTKFNCKQAVTMLGFEQRFNDVKLELKTIANGNRPVRTQPAGCTL